MDRMFRLLRADEIEIRKGFGENDDSFTVLLYKDARVDYRLLDETLGVNNWRNHYSRDNANCTIEIWDAEKNQWIAKENVGEETKIAKEKGLASDSFKRAAVTLGIGRELYTAPDIWIKKNLLSNRQRERLNKGIYGLEVEEIEYDNMDRIKTLKIKNNATGKTIYTYSGKEDLMEKEEEPIKEEPIKKEPIKKEIELVPDNITENMWKSLQTLCKQKGEKDTELLAKYGLKKPSEMKIAQYRKEMERLKNA